MMCPRLDGDFLGRHGEVVWIGREEMMAVKREEAAVGSMMLLSSLHLTL